MYHQCYSVRFFFIFLLLSTGIASTVTAQTIGLSAKNTTTGGDGSTANLGDWMRYRATVTNTTSTNISSSTVYAAIPAGTSYLPGTTKVNGTAVSDVNGQMPFRAGGLVNSASSAAGTIAPGATALVEYYVQVAANTGALYNTAALQATNSSGSTITVNSNTTQSNVLVDGGCNQVYESTSIASSQGGTNSYPYSNIKVIDNSNGTAYKTIFFGATGPCYDNTGASLRTGSVLTDAEAMAYDNSTGRIYFINGTSNNPAQDLCYIDQIYNGTSVVAAVRFTNTPLETNTGAGYNINRMTTGSDGFYALTANALDLIKFTVDRTTNVPTISRLGALINDAGNGANNVLTETGGDMFGDASGKLFLITGSCKVYRINPATRIATYIGTITGTGLPTSGTNSVAAIKDGYIYISGAYQSVYSADLTTMTAVAVNNGSSNVWKNGDYASCILPIFSPALTVTKSYTDLNTSHIGVISGDQIEYTITVANTGNINAGSVQLSDPIPAYAHYVANSTTLNGAPVADVNGAMPYAGGQLLNSPGAPAGIIMPGDANKLVIKFKVTTDPRVQVCNQATVNFADNDGSPVIYSDDPSTPAGADATCFYSDGALCTNCCEGCSTLVNNAAVGRIITAKVQPNPFRETINLQVQSNITQQVSVRLIDFYGRTVYTSTQQLSAGYNSFHVETPANLARGVYVLELLAGNNRLVQQKLIKQ